MACIYAFFSKLLACIYAFIVALLPWINNKSYVHS